MIQIGRAYTLEVVRDSDYGFFLDASPLDTILLPKRECEDLALGDKVDVFLYYDSEDRPVATRKIPKAQIGEFASLQVVDTTKVGAFMDWGLDKHLMVPFGEQKTKMEEGRHYIVFVHSNRHDGRLMGSSKLDRFLDRYPALYKTREPVELLVAAKTDLGYKVIVNNAHWGVLYADEVFKPLRIGQKLPGFIKRVRADGKIDATLQGGKQTRDRDSQTVLRYLKQLNGYAPLHDKSDPKVIEAELGLSKKAFKRAIGSLYKAKEIVIEDGGIRLTEN